MLKDKLIELYETALSNYRESKSNYDAGIVEGLKRALEVIEDE